MGIAQRTIYVKRPIDMKREERLNALKDKAKTLGDWILVKRLEKKLTPGHVAAKMGIAASLVSLWESNIHQPDSPQLKQLAQILGFEAENYAVFADSPGNEQSKI